MKKLLLCFVLLSLSVSSYAVQQVFQRGVVVEYTERGEKKPLANVQVVAANANSTVTDEHGAFLLRFNTLMPGERISLQEVGKSGYEIFNVEAVDNWRIARNPDEVFTIVVAKSSFLEKQRKQLLSKATKQATADLEKQQRELQTQFVREKLTSDEFQHRMRLLRQEYEAKLDNLENYVERFVHIDRAELTAAEQKISELIKKGRFNEAIALYEAEDLVAQYRQQMRNIKRLHNDVKTLTAAQTKVEHQRNEIHNAILREVDLLRLQGGERNIARISELYQQLAMADTTNFRAMFRYANELRETNHFNESMRVYGSIERQASALADTLSFLRARMYRGSAYFMLNQFDQGMPLLQTAMPAFEKYLQHSPDSLIYASDFAHGCMSLGYRLCRQKEENLGRKWLYKGIAHIRGMKGLESQYAILLTQTATALRNTVHSDEIIPLTQQAIHILDSLYREKPYIYRARLAYAWSSLGLDYFTQGDDYLEETINAYDRSIALYQKAVELNPEAYRRFLAQTHHFRGDYYQTVEEHALALEDYHEAERLWRADVRTEHQYDAYLSENAYAMGKSYHALGLYQQALETDLNSLRLIEPLYLNAPKFYRSAMGTSLLQIALDYYALGNLMNAQVYCQRAVAADPMWGASRRLLNELQAKLNAKN